MDAGYLYAEGGKLVAGERIERAQLSLNLAQAREAFTDFASQAAGGARLLRIYWHDGAVRNQRSNEQNAVAGLDNVKLRLGYVNSSGQQKGVDSLIVTDLIELARQKSISDAVLLSGDEDLRIGVQIAQSFGVKVHLLVGLQPARGNQSPQLIEEADTCREWGRQEVAAFLDKRSGPNL